MKTLIIIRHAKSDWNAPAGDFGRPLTENGKHNAALMAAAASANLPQSFLIWSSTATRASQTAVIFAEKVAYPVEDIIFKEDLYTFDYRDLERIIKTCDDLYESLIVFGHNEAITDFVNKFGDIFIDNVPTAGFVTLTFDTDTWKAIRSGKTGKVIFPREL